MDAPRTHRRRQLPEWLQGTWPEELYQLEHFEGGGASVEEIDLSREEYIVLQVRLAELRAIRLTPEQIENLEYDRYRNNPDRTKLAAA